MMNRMIGRRMRIGALVILGAGWIGLAPARAAEPLLSENFDSYTLPSEGDFRHMTTEGTPDDALVGVTDAEAHSKPNSLVHRVDAPDDANVLTTSTRRLGDGIPLSTTDLIQVQFKIRLDQTNTTYSAYVGDNVNKLLVRLTFTNNGQIWALNSLSNETRTVLGKYEPATWYQVTIRINVGASTWDVSIANADKPDTVLMSTTDRTFFQAPADTATSVNRITFGGTTGKGLAGATYVDDIVIQTVPKE